MTLEESTLAERDTGRKAALISALAARFRIEMIDILHDKQTGHRGGASSACEIVTALYFHRLAIDLSSPIMPLDPLPEKLRAFGWNVLPEL